MKKQIVLLTKSLKDRDYCVAGIDINNGKWIRLVHSKYGEAFPKEILDNKKINVLDVIEVEVIKSVPYHVQTENWLIDDNITIKKVGEMTKHNVLNLHPSDKPKAVFNFYGNELKECEVKTLNHSLEIINVERLILDTSLKGDGRNHYKVNFWYNGLQYNLALTDPEYRDESLDGIKFPNALIIVSIPTSPYGEDNLYYKFVAKILI